MSESLESSFGAILEQVGGEAFKAAGYTLDANSLQQGRGLYRYQKALPDGATAYLEFQVLNYGGQAPSRFRLSLLRNRGVEARDNSDPARVEITLSRLLWDQFTVRVLDGADHWWLFRTSHELGMAIAAAGKLLFGFGIPWLEGTLMP
ncbi:MAG TPA: hypothetical protein PLD47_04730 [Aggregatilineales bacterium]|nr:hypothetical protein [Anaerolineales bacterium]HRE47009.1 hypothetical protein [Aggregatilineales bacterium]